MRPRIFGCLSSGRICPFNLIFGCFFDSLLSEVRRVTVDLVCEASVLFLINQFSSFVIYFWRLAVAVISFSLRDVMVKSSA